MLKTKPKKYVAEPLYENIVNANCDRCLDSGIWLTPRNEVAECPHIQLGEDHKLQSPSATIFQREAERLKQLGHSIPMIEFETARILTHFSTDKPCQLKQLQKFFFEDTNFSEMVTQRRIKSIIENLRNVWLLPVGSRKSKPFGYWIITELEDYKSWYKSVTSQPITTLSTIHKNAKHNFPHFAEQLELIFWKDMGEEKDA